MGIGCTPTDFATEIQANSGGNALKLRGRSAGGNEGWLVWTDNADNVEAAMYATADNLIFANILRIQKECVLTLQATLELETHHQFSYNNAEIKQGSGNWYEGINNKQV